MTKITPIFDKNGKKIPFFRARSARGGGRHAARQIDPPKFTAKTTAKTQPPNSPHTHFWNSTSHHTPSTFGIPLPIIHPPLLEFQYLYIATNYGIPLFIDRLHFWNSTIYRSSPLLEFHFPSYTLHFWNSTICISPPIMEFQLSSLLQSLQFEIIIFNTPKSPIF